jgi:hypothetical protein
MNKAMINNLSVEETIQELEATDSPLVLHLLELVGTELMTHEDVEATIEVEVKEARYKMILEIHEARDLLNPADYLSPEDLEDLPENL